MKSKQFRAIGLGIFCAACWTSSVWAGQGVGVQQFPDPKAEVGVVDEPLTTRLATSGDQWRYRWQYGHWWYWMPENKWVFWSYDRWYAYNPATYLAIVATDPTQRQNRPSVQPSSQPGTVAPTPIEPTPVE